MSASEGVQSTELSRDLGLFTITMIGVGAMIGAGIFVLTGEAAGIAGPSLILSFALNGVVTVFTAMVYAELGSAIPEAGGGYLWIKEGLPGANAFLAGWMSWFAHAVAGALYALGFGAFLFELSRLLGVSWEALGLDFIMAKKGFGVAVAVAFAWINFRGASETGLAGNVVTMAKLVVIGIFCAFGLKYMFFPDTFWEVAAGGGMGTEKLRPFIPDETGWLGVLSAMGLTFIAFEGYEIIVQSGEEVVDPRRNIPKAIFWSLAIVVPIYMLVAFVLVGATATPQLLEAISAIGVTVPSSIGPDAPNWQVLRYVGELGLANAASQFVPYGAILILAGGMLSTMSALNATTFSSTRVAFAMGRDRNLPDRFAEVHEARKTPHVALTWTTVLIVLMVSFVPITTVAAAADIMFLLLFLQVNVAVITLRKKYGDRLAYGYLMPYFPAVPIIGIVTKLALALFMFDHYPVAWLYVGGWVVVGFAIFHLWASDRRRPEEDTPVVLEESPPELSPGAVLVGVSEPPEGPELARLGARMARALGSEVVLLHGVAVPRQLPLRAGRWWVDEAKAMVDPARGVAEEHGVPVRSLVRLARRPSDAIIRTTEDRGAEYLVLGWKGPHHRAARRRRVLVGATVDRVIKESRCHAILYETHLSGRNSQDVPEARRILVPVADPSRAPLALGIAASLLPLGSTDGEITVLHLSEDAMSDEYRKAFRVAVAKELRSGDEDAEEASALFGEDSRVFFDFREGVESVAEEIVAESREYQRVVIGTGVDRNLLGRHVVSAISSRVMDGSSCPVVLVRPSENALKFGVQVFFQFFRDLEAEDAEAEETEEEARRAEESESGPRVRNADEEGR